MICASLYFDFFIRISSFIFEKILLPHTPNFRGDYHPMQATQGGYSGLSVVRTCNRV